MLVRPDAAAHPGAGARSALVCSHTRPHKALNTRTPSLSHTHAYTGAARVDSDERQTGQGTNPPKWSRGKQKRWTSRSSARPASRAGSGREERGCVPLTCHRIAHRDLVALEAGVAHESTSRRHPIFLLVPSSLVALARTFRARSTARSR
jgi:hypothetical protein